MALDLTTVDLTSETVRTERLLMRPMREDDVDAIVRAFQDADNQRWLTAAPSPYTRADAVQFITEIGPAGRAAGTDLTCAVEADGEFVGACGLHSLTTGRLGPEIGYWTAPWARQRRRAGWPSGRSRTARRGRTCSRTSTTWRRRPWRGGPASRRRASCAAAWSTGTGAVPTRCCSAGWVESLVDGNRSRATPPGSDGGRFGLGGVLGCGTVERHLDQPDEAVVE